MTDGRQQTRVEAIIIANAIQTGKINYLRGLQACREKKGMSRFRLAKLTGVVHQTVQAWEAGKTWPTSYHTALIASALGCSIEELYLGPDPEEGGPT